jgi:hypothetical protein
MQGGEGLLLDGLDGNGPDVLVAVGLEKAFGIGAVGFVALDVGLDVLRREKNDVVSELLKLSGPVVGHATSLHHNVGHFAVDEEGKKARAVEAMGFGHLAGAVRDSELEDVLCNIHGNRRMLHFRTPPSFQSDEKQ